MIQSLISRLRGAKAGNALERELDSLEQRAASATWDYQGHVYTRAGDLCAGAGERPRAMTYYGRAIDAYLENGYFDVAATLCRKIIELSPEVVRARCTLAFLSLGKDMPFLPFQELLEDARREIGDYVHAAKAAGKEGLASVRLQRMALATDSPEVRELIGEYLLELGDSAGADRVLGAVYEERNHLRPPSSPEEQRERWARELRSSVVHREAAESGEPEAVGDGRRSGD